MSTKEQGGLSRRSFLKGSGRRCRRCGRFRRAGRLLVGRRRVAGVAAEELGLRVRPLGHRLRRRGHVGVAHRRRRVRPGSHRAGEGSRRGRRQQPHQQRRVDHRRGKRQRALQEVHQGVHARQDPRADDRRLGQRVRSQHRVRRQVRHDLRGVRGRAGRRHPRVLLPGRQRLRGLLQAVLRRRLRHAVVPRARRAAREAGRAGSVRLPRRASHPEPRDQGDRRRVHDDRLRGEDGQGSQGRHHDHGRLRVQRGYEAQVPQMLPLQIRGAGSTTQETASRWSRR